MTLEEFYTAISISLNIPSVYGPYKDNQAAPYITYEATEKECIYADGVVIYAEDWIELRLVTKSRDIEQEKLVENFLTSNGISFDVPDFEYDDTQHIHTTTYNFMIGG